MITACGVSCIIVFPCLLKAPFHRLYQEMNSYLHPEKLVSQNTEEALTHICTSSALEISSGILDKGSLVVPVQFTGTFMAVGNWSQTSFPPAPQQLRIFGKQMRTLSFKTKFITAKHMAGRNHVQLLHAGPSAARQAIGVKILTAQFVWQVWKAEGLEIGVKFRLTN